MTIEYITIAETGHFVRQAEGLLSRDELETLTTILATQPLAGDVIRGSKGLRKLRFATGNRGKSGSTRVIYYFYNESIPLYLLDIYAKNRQENLTPKQLIDLVKLIEGIKKSGGNNG